MLPISTGPWAEAQRPRQVVRASHLKLVGGPVDRKRVQTHVLAWVGARYGLGISGQAAEQKDFDFRMGSVRVAGATHPADQRRWGVVIESIQGWLSETAVDMLWRTEIEVYRDRAAVSLEIVHTYYADVVTNAYTPHAELALFLASALGVTDAGIEILDAPRICVTDRAVQGLINHLHDLERTLPVIVVAQEADTRQFPADIHRLAAAVSGVAHVVGLAPVALRTFKDLVGPLLYVGDGAGRIYLPGLEQTSNPLDHPLIRQHQFAGPGEADASEMEDTESYAHFLFERRLRQAAQHASASLHRQRMAFRRLQLTEPTISPVQAEELAFA